MSIIFVLPALLLDWLLKRTSVPERTRNRVVDLVGKGGVVIMLLFVPLVVAGAIIATWLGWLH